MADCKLTNQQINLRADRVFGLGYLEDRNRFGFLEALTNSMIRPIPVKNELGECVQLFVKWKDICPPTGDEECDDSCDFSPINNENCVEKTYPLANCWKMPDYSFNTAEFECLKDPATGEMLSHSLEETIAKTEMLNEKALIEQKIIPYLIGVVESAVSAPLELPSNSGVTLNGDVVNVTPNLMGEAFYMIMKNLIKKNNITRPMIIVGHQQLEDSFMIHQLKKESVLLDKLFGEFPIYFDYDNIFANLGEEAIYIINADAFALYSYNNAKPNVTGTSDLLSPTWGESILRWNQNSRFSSSVMLDKYQKITCLSDDHELIARRIKARLTMVVAPDGVCKSYPKVIKIQCA
jgi:hypothetical protein